MSLKVLILQFQKEQLDNILKDPELNGRARDNVQKNADSLQQRIVYLTEAGHGAENKNS